MDIYALIGASGTGKSHNAIQVADEYHIDAIIDDGLLIMNGKKMAGSSAKAEETKMAAVKRAIFNDPKHADEMRQRIRQLRPKSILILGTSEKMVDRIVTTLELPTVKQKIFIQEIATPEQIALAQKMRQDGKHVIPLPSIEVKKDLPNFWIDPIVNFFSKKKGGRQEEKSIVRPKFSQLGTLTIAGSVIETMVRYVLWQYDELDHSARVQVEMYDYGVSISCDMRIRFGQPIQAVIHEFQKDVAALVDDLTSLSVARIDIRITGVVL